jgi:hypothetical protein
MLSRQRNAAWLRRRIYASGGGWPKINLLMSASYPVGNVA